MRVSETLAVAFTIVVVGCSGDVPTGVVSNAPAPKVASGVSAAPQVEYRPFSGSCAADIVSLDFLSPTTAREVVVGTCQLTHLGRSTVYLRQVIDFATGRSVSEELTFTAANGDVLRATSLTTGTPTGPTTVALAGTIVFVGGTGRFAHATGSAPFVGSADLAALRATWMMRGRIAY